MNMNFYRNLILNQILLNLKNKDVNTLIIAYYYKNKFF